MMDPIAPTDAAKPVATLRACIDALNTSGAAGRLIWPDGFGVSLGTVVYVEILSVADPRFFFLVYAVLGFERGGEHDGGVHVLKIVNWYADDPPLDVAVIDVEGRTLELALIVPSCQADQAQEYAAWRDQLNRQPEVRAAAYAEVHKALESMARDWPEDF